MSRKLLCLAAVAVLVALVAFVAAANTPVNPDEPITMTKGMYADLLCMAASETDSFRGSIQFTYEPMSDLLRATYLPPMNPGKVTVDTAANMANFKVSAKVRAVSNSKPLLATLQRHVSASASVSFGGF